MSIIKNGETHRYIPIDIFDKCLIDGKTRQEISKIYQKKEVTNHKSCYYLDKFAFHIKKIANISLKEYCCKFLSIEWPKCPINGLDVGYRISGIGLRFANFNATVTQEFSPKFKQFCEKMSIERRGKGNPMYGISTWNKGLTAETDVRLKNMGLKNRGRKASEKTKQKQRENMFKRIKNGEILHNKPHSEKTKEKLRESTAKLWSEGVFNRVSSIHVKMRDFLNSLSLKSEFKEEFQVKYFSLDFAFPDAKIGIEVDGDYYHVNPKFYPNGPISAIQKRNFGRDKAKNKFLSQNGWILLRFWECEINAETYKEILICKLKELNLLKD